MIYSVRLFARGRDLAGGERVSVDLPANSTVADLRRALVVACPPLEPIVIRSAIAVDGEFAQDGDVLLEGKEIALLPPVSGG